MPEQAEIRITEIAGSKYCTASEDGQKVHARIAEAIRSGCTVRLSFKDVQDLTSAFLNSAVGKLYGEFAESEIRAKLLPPVDASADDLLLLKRVVDRAKEFFQEPERFKKAAQEALGEGDDGKSN